MQILSMYKRHEFLTLQVKSMWWVVNANLIFSLIFGIFYRKIQKKISFCIGTNSHTLPAYNPVAVLRPQVIMHSAYQPTVFVYADVDKLCFLLRGELWNKVCKCYNKAGTEFNLIKICCLQIIVFQSKSAPKDTT